MDPEKAASDVAAAKAASGFQPVPTVECRCPVESFTKPSRMSEVCAGTEPSPGLCPPEMNYFDAVAYCAIKFGDHARLCTAEELLAGATKQTGCGFEQTLVGHYHLTFLF